MGKEETEKKKEFERKKKLFGLNEIKRSIVLQRKMKNITKISFIIICFLLISLLLILLEILCINIKMLSK